MIASAGLLVLTLVLAAFLTHTKTQALIVILEPESELFQDTRVQATDRKFDSARGGVAPGVGGFRSR